ncbi:FCD domain-containing protein [Actinomycetospora sp. NBRC 106378]|uniref:GntR family transcriptional regulator n=1 Tax=Actinomycetospora sp. NBRC 106378 TaxID=3032208 RepID=UPI0024A39159|nr:FCD domain-containing protein [Actinomycetospora sp. NBRC 106378]GLZ53511.1 GntR family transcriptional regulator [Actinomycetospora sp. NBRC 106378]
MVRENEGALTRGGLREQVRELVLRRILDGVYGPGERIVEHRLTKELGISQAPVREALRELEAMRFVESQPNRGVRVRAMTAHELGEMYPVRAALEEVAGRTAAPLITEETLGLLDAEIGEMRDAASRADVHSQLHHDARFHELIIEASGNSLLFDLWRSLHVETRTLITFSRVDHDLLAIADLHLPIVRALRHRDPELVGKEMRDHIEHFGALVMGASPDEHEH